LTSIVTMVASIPCTAAPNNLVNMKMGVFYFFSS
jgi:hypothetical protein